MSGIEVLGIVASVISIADLGARLSVKLCTFSRKVKNADRSISDISNDVALTCSVLRELGDNLKSDRESHLYSNHAVTTAEGVVKECEKVFVDLEGALEGETSDAGVGRLKFKRLSGKLKYTFLEPQIELMRSNLERLKSTLLLMLNVIIYAGQLRSKADSSVLRDQQELIKTLNEDKKANDSKFHILAKAIDGLKPPQNANAPPREAPGPPAYEGSRNVMLNLAAQPADTGETRDPASEEVTHYCALVKSLLKEIEAVQYKINQEMRQSIRSHVLAIHSTQVIGLKKTHSHSVLQKAFEREPVLLEVLENIFNRGHPQVYSSSQIPSTSQNPDFRPAHPRQPLVQQNLVSVQSGPGSGIISTLEPSPINQAAIKDQSRRTHRSRSLALGDPIMSNLQSPGNQMSLVENMQSNKMPGFVINGERIASLQQLYGPYNSTPDPQSPVTTPTSIIHKDEIVVQRRPVDADNPTAQSKESLLLQQVSGYLTLLRGSILRTEHDDPESEDSSLVSTALRSYYHQKGVELPSWLLPDPERPLVFGMQSVQTEAPVTGMKQFSHQTASGRLKPSGSASYGQDATFGNFSGHVYGAHLDRKPIAEEEEDEDEEALALKRKIRLARLDSVGRIARPAAIPAATQYRRPPQNTMTPLSARGEQTRTTEKISDLKKLNGGFFATHVANPFKRSKKDQKGQDRVDRHRPQRIDEVSPKNGKMESPLKGTPVVNRTEAEPVHTAKRGKTPVQTYATTPRRPLQPTWTKHQARVDSYDAEDDETDTLLGPVGPSHPSKVMLPGRGSLYARDEHIDSLANKSDHVDETYLPAARSTEIDDLVLQWTNIDSDALGQLNQEAGIAQGRFYR